MPAQAYCLSNSPCGERSCAFLHTALAVVVVQAALTLCLPACATVAATTNVSVSRAQAVQMGWQHLQAGRFSVACDIAVSVHDAVGDSAWALYTLGTHCVSRQAPDRRQPTRLLKQAAALVSECERTPGAPCTCAIEARNPVCRVIVSPRGVPSRMFARGATQCGAVCVG